MDAIMTGAAVASREEGGKVRPSSTNAAIRFVFSSSRRVTPQATGIVCFFSIKDRILALFYAILRDNTCLAKADAPRVNPEWLLAVSPGFSVAAETVSPWPRHPRGEVKFRGIRRCRLFPMIYLFAVERRPTG